VGLFEFGEEFAEVFDRFGGLGSGLRSGWGDGLSSRLGSGHWGLLRPSFRTGGHGLGSGRRSEFRSSKFRLGEF
jgi:hypothetical protein